MEKDLLIVAILLAVVTLTFSFVLGLLKREVDELKKDVKDTMEFVCDMYDKLEKKEKEQDNRK